MARLLVVDDEPSLCQMLEIAFRKDGHTVETVSSGQAALKKIGLDVFPAMSPAEFEKFLEAEMTRWGGVIRGAGIKAE